MKCSILDNILYRVPQFPNNATLSDCWDELKNSIQLSSVEFYDQIKDVDNSMLDDLPLSVYKTIWKYFNRAKFRSTPYGTFAGYGVSPLCCGNSAEPLIIDSTSTVHSLIDWPYKNHIPVDMERLDKENGTLIANHSYYLIGNSIRYLSHIDSRFELSEITKEDTILDILKACQTEISLSALQQKIICIFENREQMMEGLGYMVELQLLFTSLHPNSIGKDYFERLGISNHPSLPQYIIAERKWVSGSLRKTQLQDLPELAECLKRLAVPFKNPSLEKFIAAFKRKFDQQDVPIMIALDPELGIGYSDLEQGLRQQTLFAEIIQSGENIPDNKEQGLRSFLCAELMKSDNGVLPVIALEKFPATTQNITLPNTLSVQLSDANGLLSIESFGGTTANAMLGRFTMAGSEVSEICKGITAIEKEANPEILFFDISYLAEGNVDNINRRKTIYDLQLSILNYNTSSQPLQLDDLLLSATGNALILKSRSLNKRLIPRLSSAYNHNRSDLSVFRLLCDLQSQDLQPNLAYDLSIIVPGLPFYPRVQYRDFIVSRAKWKVDYKDLPDGCKKDLPLFRQYLLGLGIRGYFRTGLSDQTLCFDLTGDIDLQVFRDMLKKNSTIYVQEAFIATHPIIHDMNGSPYNSEFIVTLYHKEALYHGFKLKHAPLSGKQPMRWIPPGRDWLYFEIFAHPQRANEILLEPIAQLIDEVASYIKRWFFIRYNEGGDHIRLRIQLHNPGNGYKISGRLGDLLSNYIQSGLVTDFSLKTYKRELERYGFENIDEIEEHFFKDSRYVMELLNGGYEPNYIYAICSKLVWALRAAPFFETDRFDHLIKRITIALTAENNMDHNRFKKINAAYKEYKNVLQPKLHKQLEKSFHIFLESFLKTLANCEANLRLQLFADLMHMHINRLFDSAQRVHEMLFYCFMEKELKELAARRAQRA